MPTLTASFLAWTTALAMLLGIRLVPQGLPPGVNDSQATGPIVSTGIDEAVGLFALSPRSMGLEHALGVAPVAGMVLVAARMSGFSAIAVHGGCAIPAQQDASRAISSTLDAASREACDAQGGYWYKDKCWGHFEDVGIPASKIEQVVAEQMQAVAATEITIDGEKKSIDFAFPDVDGELAILLVSFDDLQRSVVIECATEDLMSGREFNAAAVLVTGYLHGDPDDINVVASGGVRVRGSQDLDICVRGELQSEGDPTALYIRLNEAVVVKGLSKLEIKDGEAILSGTLGTMSYPQVKSLIEQHPEIKTITFGKVDGSVNDPVNMHTGRLIRNARLSTRVLSDSDIASGGVDIFCAGVERTIELGAKLGVHSWRGDTFTADQLPNDHPLHQHQIEYFEEMLGKGRGEEFYFYTLSAAPYAGVHYMAPSEMMNWTVGTSFIDRSEATKQDKANQDE